MGHSKASKANTHARLVEAAAARFKERGVDGISLSDLMKELKLTHGGFYKHFDLARRVGDRGARSWHSPWTGELRERLFDGDKADIAAFVDFYLNEAHRDHAMERAARMRGGGPGRAMRRARAPKCRRSFASRSRPTSRTLSERCVAGGRFD